MPGNGRKGERGGKGIGWEEDRTRFFSLGHKPVWAWSSSVGYKYSTPMVFPYLSKPMTGPANRTFSDDFSPASRLSSVS